MKKIVVDASVAVKLIFEEEDSSLVREIFSKVQVSKLKIIVPELFYCEVANACCVKFRKKLASFQQAVMLFEHIAALNLEKRLDSEFADIALENAMHYKISVYDALYVSLAETYLAPLVTADQKLIKACRSKGFDFIESLADIKLP